MRQAQYSAQLSAADLENERLTEQASLATFFFELRGQDALQQILDATVAADQKSLDFARAQYETGIADQIAVVQAQNTLQSAQSQATNLGVARAQYEHAIAVLIGKAASDFSIPAKPLLITPPPIPVGLPSQLLERRPDIAAAERTMAAANAQIGIAYAAYYPNLSLSATGGFESSTWKHLLDWPSRFWSDRPLGLGDRFSMPACAAPPSTSTSPPTTRIWPRTARPCSLPSSRWKTPLPLSASSPSRFSSSTRRSNPPELLSIWR